MWARYAAQASICSCLPHNSDFVQSALPRPSRTSAPCEYRNAVLEAREQENPVQTRQAVTVSRRDFKKWRDCGGADWGYGAFGVAW